MVEEFVGADESTQKYPNALLAAAAVLLNDSRWFC
jgi:hypothetical protein